MRRTPRTVIALAAATALAPAAVAIPVGAAELRPGSINVCVRKVDDAGTARTFGVRLVSDGARVAEDVIEVRRTTKRECEAVGGRLPGGRYKIVLDSLDGFETYKVLVNQNRGPIREVRVPRQHRGDDVAVRDTVDGLTTVVTFKVRSLNPDD